MPVTRKRRATALRDIITLQREIITKGESGKISTSWVDIVTDYADVEVITVNSTISSERSVSAGQIVEEHRFRITMRYRDDLVSKGAAVATPSHRYRAVYNGMYLTIHSVVDPDGFKRVLVMTAYRQDNK